MQCTRENRVENLQIGNKEEANSQTMLRARKPLKDKSLWNNRRPAQAAVMGSHMIALGDCATTGAAVQAIVRHRVTKAYAPALSGAFRSALPAACYPPQRHLRHKSGMCCSASARSAPILHHRACPASSYPWHLARCHSMPIRCTAW